MISVSFKEVAREIAIFATILTLMQSGTTVKEGIGIEFRSVEDKYTP
jgi:hypothetical protein